MLAELTIRAAHAGDAPALAVLNDQLGYPGSATWLAERIPLAQGPEQALLLACREATVLGYIHLQCQWQFTLRRPYLRIAYFCVAATARRQGIGRALIREAYRLAREWDCVRIELHSSAHRHDAHAFYEAEGFRQHPRFYIKDVTDTEVRI